MGQAANLGLTVGVLTGVGDNKDLSDADLIVPEVGDVIDLITPSEKSEMVRIITTKTSDNFTYFMLLDVQSVQKHENYRQRAVKDSWDIINPQIILDSKTSSLQTTTTYMNDIYL